MFRQYRHDKQITIHISKYTTRGENTRNEHNDNGELEEMKRPPRLSRFIITSFLRICTDRIRQAEELNMGELKLYIYYELLLASPVQTLYCTHMYTWCICAYSIV